MDKSFDVKARVHSIGNSFTLSIQLLFRMQRRHLPSIQFNVLIQQYENNLQHLSFTSKVSKFFTIFQQTIFIYQSNTKMK